MAWCAIPTAGTRRSPRSSRAMPIGWRRTSASSFGSLLFGSAFLLGVLGQRGIAGSARPRSQFGRIVVKPFGNGEPAGVDHPLAPRVGERLAAFSLEGG